MQEFTATVNDKSGDRDMEITAFVVSLMIYFLEFPGL